MAVMRNSIIFGGVNSADFGIYISGEGVFNAPKRAVEYVQVPGRSGAIAMDLGYYENIEVEYPAFNYEPEMADFIQALRSFRNAICSQTGYQRLNDTFHPDEYRMAVYSEGLEVDPVKFNTASEFTLKFNCKPQRYLLSGESAVEMASGSSLYNPTPFDASPLLEVEGYGEIEFNGYSIEIENANFGQITLVDNGSFTTQNYEVALDSKLFANGDPITISGLNCICRGRNNPASGVNYLYHDNMSATNTASGVSNSWIAQAGGNIQYGFFVLNLIFPDIVFTAGTNGSFTNTTTIVGEAYKYGDDSIHKTVTSVFTTVIAYNATTDVITITRTSSATVQDSTFTADTFYNDAFSGRDNNHGTISVDSTETYLGHPTYIDCDLGDAYKVDDDDYISLNSYIDLGSDLPTLASGANEVVFSNTITSLKIIPRWWIL